MKATYQMENPDKANFTLKVTMGLEDWKRFQKQIPGSGYPGWKISGTISDMIVAAHKHFDASEKDAS